MNEEKLYTLIYNKLKEEDKEFTNLTREGIFFAPELYVAIVLGRIIKKNEWEIFGCETSWKREIDLKNGGPTDFVFKCDKETVVFELKLRQTIDAYKSDIEKLNRLSSGFKKYFIALVDTWAKDKENDERILKLEKEYPKLKRICNFQSFITEQNWYKNQIACTLCIWEVIE